MKKKGRSKNIGVARKVGPPWLFLLVFLVIWFCPFFSLAEADVKEAPKVRSSQTKTQTGKASYYCKKFHGKNKVFGYKIVLKFPSLETKCYE